MAEQALKRLEEQLNCSICLETFTDPKLLQCFHVYCQQCLVPLGVRDQQGQLSLTCPTCRQVTPIPPRGVAGLQSAFHINHLLEIQDSVKKLQNPPANFEGAVGGTVVENPPKNAAQFCFEHVERELELYCETCGELICYKCGLKGGKHHSHDYEELNNKSDVLMMKANTVHQMKELTTPFQPDTLTPFPTEADMVFSALAVDLTAACKNDGKIFSPRSPDSSKCHATGKGLEVAAVGVKSTAILHAVSYEGKRFDKPIKSLECELVPEITGTRTNSNVNVERRGQSQYEISYQPTIKGRHQLLEGQQHIRGSPSSVAPVDLEKLDTPILTLGGVDEPMGVAITKRGEVVATEGGGHCVTVFSPRGEKLRSFGTRGCGQGRFNWPCGVTVDGEGNILVADTSNCRIQKFTAEGQFLTAVGKYGSGPLQFCCPHDIAFNTINNKVYVADGSNNRTQVLNSDLTFSSTFGKQGNGKGQFSCPWGIACDSTGKVYVAETGNNRIQVFTAEGKFIRMFGRHGYCRGELAEPLYVAVDTRGMVYVSEDDNYHVSVFTMEGQFVTSFGRAGPRAGPGELNFPRGLAVDNNNGVVYVCYRDNSIKAF